MGNLILDSVESLSVQQIRSLSEYVKAVTDINDTIIKGAVYRGQPDYRFGLSSTLQRSLVRDENPTALDRAKNGFKIFRAERHLYHDTRTLSQWDELTLAQHYGLPTRLLDWTLDPLTGLYFALESINEKNVTGDACVYMLPANSGLAWLTSSEMEGDVFSDLSHISFGKESVILLPDYLNARVRNQAGVFSVSTNIFSEFPKSRLHHLIIPSDSILKLKAQLIQFGITRKRIYLDVESLCSELKSSHY